jgi:hypothetical protein
MLCIIEIKELDKRNSDNFETFGGALSDFVSLQVVVVICCKAACSLVDCFTPHLGLFFLC